MKPSNSLKSHKLKLWLNYATFGLSLVTNLGLLVYRVIFINRLAMLSTVAHVAQGVSLIVAQFLLAVRRQSLAANTFQAAKLITSTDKARFRTQCNLKCIIFVIYIIVELILTAYNLRNIELFSQSAIINDKVRDGLNFVIDKLCLLLVSIYYNGLFVYTLLLYATKFQLIEGLCRVVNTTTTVKLRTFSEISRSPTGLDKLRNLRYKVFLIISNVEQSLSLLPFVWITTLFLETTGNLMASTDFGFDMGRIFLFWSNLLVKFLFIVYTTISVDKVATKNDHTHRELIANFLISSTNHDLVSHFKEKAFLFEVSKFPLTKPTASGFFKFNRKALLSFGSAAISISVMLLSMFSQNQPTK